MQTQEVVEHIDRLTLAHMDTEVDIDMLLTSDYPGVEQHLALAITQAYYKRFAEKILPNHAKIQHRALTNAKFMATQRLVREMHDLVDKATLFMLNDAEETGWYHDLEMDSLMELLANIYDEAEDQTSEYYDWRFIVETLVPMARTVGVSNSDLYSASCQIKKLRGIVPSARFLLKRYEDEEVSEEQVKEELTMMIKKVADPKVSYRQLKEDMDIYRGKVRQLEPLVGYKYIVPGNKTWMVVELQEERDVSMIEQALRHRVDYRLTGLDRLFDSVRVMSKKERNNGRPEGHDEADLVLKHLQAH